MSLIDQLRLMTGKPIDFHGQCLLYHATVGDIASIGTQTFYKYLYTLLYDPSDMRKQLDMEIDTLQFFLIQTHFDSDFLNLLNEAFNFFIHEPVHMIIESQRIQIGDQIENMRYFDSSNYEQFKDWLRQMYCLSKAPQHHIKAGDARAQQIRAKLQRGRKQISKIKAKKGSDIDLPVLVSSLGLYYQNIQLVWNLPYYTFCDQIERLQQRQRYNNNMMFTAAGAKIPKKEMNYWICKVQDSKGG